MNEPIIVNPECNGGVSAEDRAMAAGKLSETPETDIVLGGTGDWGGEDGSFEEAAGLARRFERERDGLKEAIRNFEECVQETMVERDNARDAHKEAVAALREAMNTIAGSRAPNKLPREWQRWTEIVNRKGGDG